MNILISAATERELGPHFSNKLAYKNIQVEPIVSGVGMLSATYRLTESCITTKWDLIINIGIAGSFTGSLELADVVNVVEENLSELGAEDGGDFINIFELGLIHKDEKPYSNGVLKPFDPPVLKVLRNLPICKGITVNTVHGNEHHISSVKARYNADVESMEGAAHFYVSNLQDIPCLQIRAISNYIERRDRSKWKVEKALENLWKVVSALLNELDQK